MSRHGAGAHCGEGRQRCWDTSVLFPDRSLQELPRTATGTLQRFKLRAQSAKLRTDIGAYSDYCLIRPLLWVGQG